MQNPLQFYKNRQNIVSEIHAAIVKKRQWITALRFILFIAAIIFLVLFIRNDIGHFLPSLICFAGFLAVVRYDAKLLEKKNFISKQLIFIENEIGVLNNKENQFDFGTSLESDENYTDDLDVFGRFSIFHLLNRCSTRHGIMMLASRLKQSFTQREIINKYQDAVKAFASQPILAEHVIAAGMMSGENAGTLNDVNDWISSPSKFSRKTYIKILRFLFPVINLATAYYWLDAGNFLPFLISVIITWIFLGSITRYIQEQHQLIGKKSDILNQYAGILYEFKNVKTASSTYLEELKNLSAKAFSEVKKISKLSELFDQRLNGIVFILLNSFFLYDLQILISLENWKEKNKHSFQSWLSAVADIEYLASLSVFTFNNPSFCFPQIRENSQTIQAVQLSHPLIPADERVYNDFIIGGDEKLMLITGSNMSGKSTFLRSIGINVLLAQCGAPVCAQSFQLAPIRLLTCIRVTDSLHEHTSYFMAELKKLQQIIHALRQDVFSLVLIDEILRGTNSDDKHHGSQKYIEQLISFNCLSLFATHDVQLGLMEQSFPGRVSNYCFESQIQNDEILFDYKLHKGVSKNRNASFLMKKMEII